MVMDNDTIFETEERLYVNPQTSLDEQTEFINTLRDIQAQNTAEINQNTYNLGTPVTSNIGGLTGSEGLWQAQYQTPQTQATVAGLKAAMQQQALNTELQNQQNFWKNRYNQAQRRYNRAASTYPKNPASDGDLKFEPEDELPNATSEWEGPSSAGDNTIVTQEDETHYTATDIKYGVPIDNTQGLNVNQIIKQIESQGHTVTNRNLNVDKDGFLTLNIKTKDGADDTLTINMRSNLTNRGY